MLSRRHFACSVFACVFLAAEGAVGAALAQAAPLSLAERRALAQFQEQRLPGLVRAIHEAAGVDIPVEINWDEVAVRGEAQWYNDDDYFVVIFFRPLETALKAVASDQMGRDAVKAKLKRIVLRYDEATAPLSNYPNGVRFAEGVLTINFRPRANVADIAPRAAAIRAELEKGL